MKTYILILLASYLPHFTLQAQTVSNHNVVYIPGQTNVNAQYLPDVPSAAQVVKDGIDVATMDAKLLQKVEELTLYVIQQQKQIDELQKKLDAQTKK